MLDTHRQCMSPVAAGNTNPVTPISYSFVCLGLNVTKNLLDIFELVYWKYFEILKTFALKQRSRRGRNPDPPTKQQHFRPSSSQPDVTTSIFPSRDITSHRFQVEIPMATKSLFPMLTVLVKSQCTSRYLMVKTTMIILK